MQKRGDQQELNSGNNYVEQLDPARIVPQSLYQAQLVQRHKLLNLAPLQLGKQFGNPIKQSVIWTSTEPSSRYSRRKRNIIPNNSPFCSPSSASTQPA